jgi:hypothetical protein
MSRDEGGRFLRSCGIIRYEGSENQSMKEVKN